jgi:hypothetical protein
MFGRVTKRWRTQLCNEQSFLRSYYIPKSDESNGQMCFIQGRLIMLPIKKILFPSSFWGIFDFFLFFLYILTKNKRILRYKGGTRIANIQVQGMMTRLMFLGNDTRKNPPVAKGVKTQAQTVTRLMGKGCKCG